MRHRYLIRHILFFIVWLIVLVLICFPIIGAWTLLVTLPSIIWCSFRYGDGGVSTDYAWADPLWVARGILEPVRRRCFSASKE